MNNIFGHVVVLYFIAILYIFKDFLGYANIFKTEEVAGGQNTPIFKCRMHYKNPRDQLFTSLKPNLCQDINGGFFIYMVRS